MITLRNTRHKDLEVSTQQLGTSSTPSHLLGDAHTETLRLCPRRCSAPCAHLKERADGSRWLVVCEETSLNYIIQPCSDHPPELWFGDFIFTVLCYFGFTKERCLFSFVCLFVCMNKHAPAQCNDRPSRAKNHMQTCLRLWKKKMGLLSTTRQLGRWGTVMVNTYPVCYWRQTDRQTKNSSCPVDRGTKKWWGVAEVGDLIGTQ